MFLEYINKVEGSLGRAEIILMGFLYHVTAFFTLIFLITHISITDADGCSQIPMTSQHKLVTVTDTAAIELTLIAKVF